MHGLVDSLNIAAILAQLEHKPAEVERLESEVIELSARQNFAHWLPLGFILRGWARSVLGNTTEGIACIEECASRLDRTLVNNSWRLTFTVFILREA
jgi:hypothetical protein